MADDGLAYKSIAELSREYRSGKLSPVEVTKHFLGRIEKLDTKLHAFIQVTRERALVEARGAEAELNVGHDRGPLHGIPYAVKDLYDVKGCATTGGTHLLENNVAQADCAAVNRLAGAGMVLLGKTHTVQFALGLIGINHDHGTPHNPWHETAHVPGGSSSGSAVAVAGGLAPMALGTDTGGSVRVPSALCGTVGLKTTVGRISRAGVFPLSWTMDSVGPLCRSVEDAALTYQALQGEDLEDPSTRGVGPHDVLGSLKSGVKGLRLAFGETAFFDDCDAEVAKAVRETGKALKSLGAQVDSIETPEVQELLNNPHVRSIFMAEARTSNLKLVEEHPGEIDPIVMQLLDLGGSYSAPEYAGALHMIAGMQQRITERLRDVDALIVPTTKLPALPLAEVDADLESYNRYFPFYARNTNVGNFLNLCGVSLPCGFTSNGLPIGLLVYAKPFQEDVALRVAYAYEEATQWHEHRPDLSWAG